MALLSPRRITALAAVLAVALSGCGGTTETPPIEEEATFWTDTQTSLSWQLRTKSEGMTYADAEAHCEALVIQGLQDWRLPTITELRSLLRGCPGTVSSGSCRAHDSCTAYSCGGAGCSECYGGEGPAQGCFRPSELQGTCGGTWSSSAVEGYGHLRWHVAFWDGGVSRSDTNASTLNLTRCVRGK